MNHMVPHGKLLCNRILFGLICWIFILGLNYGCQTRVYVTEAPSEQVKFKKILVLAFKDVTMMSGDAVDTRCPVCGRVFITGEVAGGAANFLTDQFIALLGRHTDYQLVFERLTAGSLAALYSANQTTVAAKKALAGEGRENDADVVLVGFVYRFRERIGKGYGVESPASVAFGMHLIRVADSRLIWSAHFDETQKSLGDNLFQLGTFISRGGRWVTAEELATSGLEEIFEKFPKPDRPASDS
jgi:hypothetical protein